MGMDLSEAYREFGAIVDFSAADLSIVTPKERLTMMFEYGIAVEIDPNIPFIRYYLACTEMIKLADSYLAAENYENAFILYIKAVTILVDRLLTHPEYERVSDEGLEMIHLKAAYVLPKMDALSKLLLEMYKKQYEAYLKLCDEMHRKAGEKERTTLVEEELQVISMEESETEIPGGKEAGAAQEEEKEGEEEVEEEGYDFSCVKFSKASEGEPAETRTPFSSFAGRLKRQKKPRKYCITCRAECTGRCAEKTGVRVTTLEKSIATIQEKLAQLNQSSTAECSDENQFSMIREILKSSIQRAVIAEAAMAVEVRGMGKCQDEAEGEKSLKVISPEQKSRSETSLKSPILSGDQIYSFTSSGEGSRAESETASDTRITAAACDEEAPSGPSTSKVSPSKEISSPGLTAIVAAVPEVKTGLGIKSVGPVGASRPIYKAPIHKDKSFGKSVPATPGEEEIQGSKSSLVSTVSEVIPMKLAEPDRSKCQTHPDQIIIPGMLTQRFLIAAQENTKANKETVGILSGTKDEDDRIKISHLLIPKQVGFADSVSTRHEDEVAYFQGDFGLKTFGWIHTHPTQKAFMSSPDLHTQHKLQRFNPVGLSMLGIVCAPKYNDTLFAVLTDYGCLVLATCEQEDVTCHQHPSERPLYTRAKNYTLDTLAPLTVVDFRYLKASDLY